MYKRLEKFNYFQYYLSRLLGRYTKMQKDCFWFCEGISSCYASTHWLDILHSFAYWQRFFRKDEDFLYFLYDHTTTHLIYDTWNCWINQTFMELTRTFTRLPSKHDVYNSSIIWMSADTMFGNRINNKKRFEGSWIAYISYLWNTFFLVKIEELYCSVHGCLFKDVN